VIVSSYHFLLGPLVALGALGLIVLICRWVFSTTERDDRTARRLEKARASGDFGLLVPVATVRVADDAEMLQAVLRDAGIRATVAPATSQEGEPAGWAVLVFRSDAAAAEALIHPRLGRSSAP
jgi:hypothetical protein